MHGMPLPALLSGCALLPSPLGQIHREVGKVNDTMFVKGLGRQVHQQMRTKTDSFPEAADRVSHASHTSPRSRPGCSRPWALAKGEKPLIRKQEGKKKTSWVLKRQNVQPLCPTVARRCTSAIPKQDFDFVTQLLRCLSTCHVDFLSTFSVQG